MRREWSAKELKTLERLLAEGRTDAEIAGQLDRPLSSVQARRITMTGEHRPRGRQWTKEEIEALTSMWGQAVSITAIGMRLDCSEFAVRKKARELELGDRPAKIARRDREPGTYCEECGADLVHPCPVPRCPRYQRVDPAEGSPVGSSFNSAVTLRYQGNRGAS